MIEKKFRLYINMTSGNVESFMVDKNEMEDVLVKFGSGGDLIIIIGDSVFNINNITHIKCAELN